MPKEARIIYIVPLINIFYSLREEMTKLQIPHQILEPSSNNNIDRRSQVVCISPEKLLDPKIVGEISKNSWSAICIDEPHLALIWGTSKSRFSKPFREAFGKLSRLNNLSTCFELHSATIFDEEKIFELLGRKNSNWMKQIQLPDRENLTLYLFSGRNAPDNILSLPSVSNAFEDEDGLLMIFVQRISDGSSIHMELLNHCEENNFVKFCPKEGKPFKPIAFLHSSLSEIAKTRILSDAKEKKLRVLIATNCAGTGINIPVTHFIGWGLDPEPCGIIQSMGRTCRKPITAEGAVIWVQHPRIHGRRIPSGSKVRDLLDNNECLRKTSNGWFAHNLPLDAGINPLPELCCSKCMEKCVKDSDCNVCSEKLKKYVPKSGLNFNLKSTKKMLTEFLVNLNINRNLPDGTFSYKEDSLSEEILKYLTTSESVEDLKDFLLIFSLGDQLNRKIIRFITHVLNNPLNEGDGTEFETNSESVSEDDSEAEEKTDISSEYFDEEV